MSYCRARGSRARSARPPRSTVGRPPAMLQIGASAFSMRARSSDAANLRPARRSRPAAARLVLRPARRRRRRLAAVCCQAVRDTVTPLWRSAPRKRRDLAALGGDLLLLQLHHVLHGVQPLQDRRIVGERRRGDARASAALPRRSVRRSHGLAPRMMKPSFWKIARASGPLRKSRNAFASGLRVFHERGRIDDRLHGYCPGTCRPRCTRFLAQRIGRVDDAERGLAARTHR